MIDRTNLRPRDILHFSYFGELQNRLIPTQISNVMVSSGNLKWSVRFRLFSVRLDVESLPNLDGKNVMIISIEHNEKRKLEYNYVAPG